MTAYFEIEDALQILDRYGIHIRDIGLLAAALARPAATVLGGSPSAVADEGSCLTGVGGAVPSSDRRQQTKGVNADGSDALDQRLPA